MTSILLNLTVPHLESAHVARARMIEGIAGPTCVVPAAGCVRSKKQTAVLAWVAIPAPIRPHGDVLSHAALRVAGLVEGVRVAAEYLELPG